MIAHHNCYIFTHKLQTQLQTDTANTEQVLTNSILEFSKL